MEDSNAVSTASSRTFFLTTQTLFLVLLYLVQAQSDGSCAESTSNDVLYRR